MLAVKLGLNGQQCAQLAQGLHAMLCHEGASEDVKAAVAEKIPLTSSDRLRVPVQELLSQPRIVSVCVCVCVCV